MQTVIGMMKYNESGGDMRFAGMGDQHLVGGLDTGNQVVYYYVPFIISDNYHFSAPIQ